MEIEVMKIHKVTGEGKIVTKGKGLVNLDTVKSHDPVEDKLGWTCLSHLREKDYTLVEECYDSYSKRVRNIRSTNMLIDINA